MAKVVESLPFTGKTSRYPWKEWFDGRVWQLTQGEDFSVSVESFRSTICASANRMHIKVVTRRKGKDLYIQAIKCESSS